MRARKLLPRTSFRGLSRVSVLQASPHRSSTSAKLAPAQREHASRPHTCCSQACRFRDLRELPKDLATTCDRLRTEVRHSTPCRHTFRRTRMLRGEPRRSGPPNDRTAGRLVARARRRPSGAPAARAPSAKPPPGARRVDAQRAAGQRDMKKARHRTHEAHLAPQGAPEAVGFAAARREVHSRALSSGLALRSRSVLNNSAIAA